MSFKSPSPKPHLNWTGSVFALPKSVCFSNRAFADAIFEGPKGHPNGVFEASTLASTKARLQSTIREVPSPSFTFKFQTAA